MLPVALGTLVCEDEHRAWEKRSRSPSSPGGETSLILRSEHPAFCSPDHTLSLPGTQGHSAGHQCLPGQFWEIHSRLLVMIFFMGTLTTRRSIPNFFLSMSFSL